MDGVINDKQRMTFANLTSRAIPDLIRQSSLEIDDCHTLTFKPFPVVTGDCISENGTDYVVVRTQCVLKDSESGEKVAFNLDLLKLPVYSELGFKIKGNYMQLLDSYERVPGWHFTLEKEGTPKFRNTASAVAVQGKSFEFVYDSKEKMHAVFKLTSKKNKKISVSVSTFLRAVTGMSNEELIARFGFDNPFVVKAFNGSRAGCIEPKQIKSLASRNDCIHALACAVLGIHVISDENFKSVYMKQRELEKQLFSERYLSFGKYNRERMEYLQSFQYRALGKVLAETVEAVGCVLHAGTVLSNQDLQVLDNSDVSCIRVKHNGKVFTLHKFSMLTFRALGMKLAEEVPGCGIKKQSVLSVSDLNEINRLEIDELDVIDPASRRKVTLVRQPGTGALTKDDLLTMFDIWVNNLNGFDTYDNTYDLTNRKLRSFDVRVLDLIQEHLDFVIQDITDRLKIRGTAASLLSAVTGYNTKIDLDAFINFVSASDTNTGQLSDMCNIMSFVSKDYKSSFDFAGHYSDDLVNVQNLQNGRTDPFDVPESEKIALVQHRTVLAKLNKDGGITAPYLRVKNGALVSSEPVYLTAIEESDKYIAEWNETFHDEDGKLKETVRVRCNGDIVTTNTANVMYKCYSPYQSMSVTHATIPFPGHSDGKRITMGCNQITQAVPLVNGKRPYVNAGGESLVNFGFYYARDVLKDYADNLIGTYSDLEPYRDELLGSSLRLTHMQSAEGRRILTFSVENAESVAARAGKSFPLTAELSYPYLAGNFELGMFTYNINHKDGGIYMPDDVIAYSNSCSLEDMPHIDCMDTGGHTVDTEAFNKGLALVQNLVVGYKTYEGSTIDDAVTISDELVYNDDLTSVTIYRITEPLHDSDERMEMFSTKSDSPYKYLGSNGLPEKGTVLHPCDPVISKLSVKNSSYVAHYRFLSPYQQGQVISAEIKLKNNEKYAEVVLAERSVIEIGDKLAGRCGNKGVIAKIVPAEQMPYDPVTGLRLQIILNPLGIPSRQNLSQLLEALLSMCLKMDAKISYVSPYNEKGLDFVRGQAEGHNVHPAVFIDGRTGLPFERPINYGVISMYKLHHMVKKKIHAVGMDTPLDPVFLQPRKGSKFDGGQSFGEMELWCLEGIGAKHILQDLYSVQSNDVKGKALVRRSLENGLHIQSANGENHNDASMQCCYRALCVEFVTNQEENCYEFVPLTDGVIRSFSPYPVSDRFALHNPSIFGKTDKLADRDASRYKWGWLDLKTELVHPIWIEKGSLHKMFIFLEGKRGRTPSLATRKDLKDIIDGKLYVLFDTGVSTAYNARWVASVEKKDTCLCYDELSSEWKACAETGMPALVRLFKTTDTADTEAFLRDMICKKLCDSQNPSEELFEEVLKRFSGEAGGIPDDVLELVKQYRHAVNFSSSEYGLKDYVITSYPVVPQIYRPEFKNAGNLSTPDFDWHYCQILNAADNVSRDINIESVKQLYERLRIFAGLGDSGTKKDQKYQNILNYFAGKNRKSHGKIRQNIQSKRICCSGRASITPTSNVEMLPTQIGIPFTSLVEVYESQLIGLLKDYTSAVGDIPSTAWAKLLMYVALRDRQLFDRFYAEKFSQLLMFEAVTAFNEITELITDYLEGRNGFSKQVVLSGRHPSLHKYSMRAFNPVIVYGKTIQVHTLVCSGYNADFDGDQMWFAALISQDAKDEAMRLLSPSKDCINPKNQSVILTHTQDTALGVYCATMLKDNTDSPDYDISMVHHYRSFDEMRLDLDAGAAHAYDLACVRVNGVQYLSTIGRLLFNSLVPGSFTGQDFTNPIGVRGITKKSCYGELKYDGIITSGKVRSGGIRYYNLQDICKEQYLADPDGCINVYQDIVEFGFKFSDVFSVSLSIEDMEIVSNKEEMLKEADRLKTQIESDCQDGLISAEDRKEAIISLYNDNEKGIHGIVQKDMIKNLSRNNNLFIMVDSGARGSEGQIMRMCGFLPQLQKDKVTTLETPVTSNFYKGLSDFDVHMTSYSVRTGFASTQNETPRAGYATHQVVFMTSGVKIAEHDCGKKNWWFDILWGDRLSEKDRFLPSYEWFSQNLLGREIAPSDSAAQKQFCTEDGVIKEKAFTMLNASRGFHEVHFSDGSSYVVSLNDLRNKVLLKSDYRSMRIMGRLLNNGRITNSCIHVIGKHHLQQVETADGCYYFHYRMDECCKSLLQYRVVRDGTLPYTDIVTDDNGNRLEVITAETLRYVEENNINRIQARILLDCESSHGVCMHCYGLKYSDLRFPAVGEFVGTEAAQAIGEPSAQLTISLVNKGGTAGAAINSGVEKFDSLLNGTVLGGVSDDTTAVIAPHSGYVHIKRLDETVLVAIEPRCKNEGVCGGCGFYGEALSSGKSCRDYILCNESPCQLGQRIHSASLLLLDREWVDAGEPVTSHIVFPDKIRRVAVEDSGHEVQDTSDNTLLLRKKQMAWLLNYFNTFMDNSIIISARHFEILTRIQNAYVTVTHSVNPEFKIGEKYEVSEVLPYADQVSYRMGVSKRDEVILRTSGAMASLAFERIADVAASLVNRCYKSSCSHNNSLIGCISAGSDLVTGKIKVFSRPDIRKHRFQEPDSNGDSALSKILSFKQAVQDNDSIQAIDAEIDGLDFDSLMQDLEKLSAFDDAPAEDSGFMEEPAFGGEEEPASEDKKEGVFEEEYEEKPEVQVQKISSF